LDLKVNHLGTVDITAGKPPRITSVEDSINSDYSLVSTKNVKNKTLGVGTHQPVTLAKKA